jgi:hypothetical protein
LKKYAQVINKMFHKSNHGNVAFDLRPGFYFSLNGDKIMATKISQDGAIKSAEANPMKLPPELKS